MICIDSKVTMWVRATIDDSYADALMGFLAKNPQASQADIENWLDEEGIEFEVEALEATEESLSPDEHNGSVTIEVATDDNLFLWHNKPK